MSCSSPRPGNRWHQEKAHAGVLPVGGWGKGRWGGRRGRRGRWGRGKRESWRWENMLVDGKQNQRKTWSILNERKLRPREKLGSQPLGHPLCRHQLLGRAFVVMPGWSPREGLGEGVGGRQEREKGLRGGERRVGAEVGGQELCRATFTSMPLTQRAAQASHLRSQLVLGCVTVWFDGWLRSFLTQGACTRAQTEGELIFQTSISPQGDTSSPSHHGPCGSPDPRLGPDLLVTWMVALFGLGQ